MTLPILFLICGFFWGVMFEKNRTVKQLMRDPEAFRHAYLKEACKRLSATILLPSRKNTLAGFLRSVWTMCVGLVILLITGCTLPMGSPMGYAPTPITNSPTIEPVCFYIPPAAMSFTTGQWQAPPVEPFQPTTPIPRPFFGQVGNQTFHGLQ